MTDQYRKHRRWFLRLALSGLASLPVASLAWRTAAAEEGGLPLVAEDDPSAVALGYVADAGKADTAKFPKRAGDAGSKQFCHNCSLYQGQGTEGAGPCAIFPGKHVKAAGWCNAWTPKPA
jgi:hypothetical protein